MQELRSAQPSPAEEMFKVGYPTLVLKSSGTLYPEGPKDPGTVANESFDKAPPELLEQLGTADIDVGAINSKILWSCATSQVSKRLFNSQASHL